LLKIWYRAGTDRQAVHASSSSCGPFIIHSQEDADAIRQACPTVTGDIAFATDVSSAISLDGVEVIQGQVSSSGSNMTALTSSTLSSTWNFVLQNQTDLLNISFPNLETVSSDFNLDTLPALHSILVPKLGVVGGFRLVNAPNLAFLQINLQSFTTDLELIDYKSAIILSNLGLVSLSGLDVTDGTLFTSLTVQDVPNLRQFNWTSPGFGRVIINGAGNLDFITFEPKRQQDKFLDDLTFNVSGLRSFTYASDQPIVLREAYFNGNTMTELNLTKLPVATSLFITNNDRLVSLTLPGHSEDDFTDRYTGNDFSIAIINNTQLSSDNITQASGSWPWGIVQAASMVFQNCPFHTEFL
jgi:hypothetical protein